MPGEVSNLLARKRIIERDDSRIARRGKEFARRAESDGAHGFEEAGEGVSEALGAVVEDVDAAVLVAGGCHCAVGGEVDGEAEGTFGFVLGDSLGGCLVVRGARCGGGVVDIDAAVVGCGGEVFAIFAESNGPAFACFFLILGYYVSSRAPRCAVLAYLPYLEFAAETCACGYLAVLAGADMMRAEWVDLFERLGERVGVLVCCCICVDDLAFGAVDLDAGGARGYEEVGWCRSEREDICCGLGGGEGVGLEVLFGLCLRVSRYS